MQVGRAQPLQWGMEYWSGAGDGMVGPQSCISPTLRYLAGGTPALPGDVNGSGWQGGEIRIVVGVLGEQTFYCPDGMKG